jgi:hypothetical protein
VFKYTAHPDVLKKYASIKKNSKRPWDDHFFFAKHITWSAAAYFSCGDFWRHYFACKFYSVNRRTHVPINGVLIPVEWFTETKEY